MTATEFEHTVLPFCPEMLRTARSVLGNEDDAADMVQETLLMAWQEQHSVREWRSYLMRSVRNRCLNLLRDSHPERYAEMPADYDPSETATPEALLIEQDARAALSRMIAALPPKAARVMTLAVYEQMSIAEIAAQTGETEANVRQILSRSRRALIDRHKHKP